MDDLISRQAAVDAIITLWANKPFGNPALTEIKECVEQVPSAQTERKKGKWVFEDGKPVNRTLEMCEIAICNQCGEKAPGYPFWECDLELTNFCPHCGAKMDGERREE